MRVSTKQFSVVFILMLLMVGLSSCKYLDDKRNPSMAEFQVMIENTGMAYPIMKSGAFTTPIGASEPGPLMPGAAYEVKFTAPVGTHVSLINQNQVTIRAEQGKRLTFATMYVQSNDLFYAPWRMESGYLRMAVPSPRYHQPNSPVGCRNGSE